MSQRLLSIWGLLFILVFSACTSNQQSQQQYPEVLPRSTPEAEGVSSEGIIKYLEAVESKQLEMNSFMMLRHGKVIAEGWWAPYRSIQNHVMFSVSKTFTSTAIGFAVSENLVTVNDKVTSFFPEYLPEVVSPYLAQLTIKDLLTMSVGQDPILTATERDPNWIKAFLGKEFVNEPGTKYLYDSNGTYMLSAIIQKVTGQKLLDYLSPRLLDPLCIKGYSWEEDPMGINVGGSGMRFKTEDMAKLGQFYLQKGKWNGNQLLPEAWIAEASTGHILQHPDIEQEKRDKSDWEQGYCYQMWRSRHNSYRADGAMGQFILIMPDLDVVIALTANIRNTPEEQKTQTELNVVWDNILPAIQNDPLPANTAMQEALKQKLASLKLPTPVK